MPLHSYPLNDTLHHRIRRKVATLCKTGILTVPNSKKFTVGFCMPIQLVPQKQIASLRFGEPEGLRIFIQCGEDVVAAVDFFFKNHKLKLSQIYEGNGLQELTVLLNRLEKKYATTDKLFHVELISFLLSPGIYMLARGKKEIHYYTFSKERLSAVSAGKLQKQVDQLIRKTMLYNSN